MIADALRALIEEYAAHVEDDNVLYQLAAAGRLSPKALSYYLFNVQHLVAHTPRHLERARERALQMGNESLARHFAVKWAEEQGHDAWAADDRMRVRTRFQTQTQDALSPALLELISFNEDTIERDPTLYLAYILFAEYHVVLLGPKWLKLLNDRCGIPPAMVSVVAKHAELDKDHTAEGLDAIDELVPDPVRLEPMRDIVRRTIALFDRFCADIVAAADDRGAEQEQVAVWKVSSVA